MYTANATGKPGESDMALVRLVPSLYRELGNQEAKNTSAKGPDTDTADVLINHADLQTSQ